LSPPSLSTSVIGAAVAIRTAGRYAVDTC